MIQDRINSIFIDIQSGSGGVDAQDWAEMLLRMYKKYCEKNKYKFEVIYAQYGDIAGLKKATISIKDKSAFNNLRNETGIHRLVRKSPFKSNNKRHTSFASIFVYPKINNNIKVDIVSNEIKIDTYRSGGAGGQHVNKTDSAVRITHIPTGISTQCQNFRSQHKNKEGAISQLKSKIYELNKIENQKKKDIVERSKNNIGWGNQIRSYIFDKSRIKDLRTGIETTKFQSILNGNLNIFIRK